MSKMIEVEIDSVRVSLTNQQRIVILKQVNRERYLPIWIGLYEAEAIDACGNIGQAHGMLVLCAGRQCSRHGCDDRITGPGDIEYFSRMRGDMHAVTLC